ncbi:MAG: RT0821/Lpp0805 family surface protein [Gammaproteobacteria bacterium]
MKNILNYSLICALSIVLTSCATQVPLIPEVNGQPQEKPSETQISDAKLTPINGPGIGLESMDEGDRDKMNHALDKGLGKATDWVNPKTGIHYSVVPVAKLTYQNNPFCRKYNVTVTRQTTSRELIGTACVSATDSGWHVVH